MLTKEKDKVQIGSSENLRAFKSGIDNLIARRQYFMSHVLPILKEGQDYHVIRNKKSLSKGGAEKIASIYNYQAFFEQDDQMMTIFKNIPGLISFICNLYCNGEKVGQGRGSAVLSKNENDANKTCKMATKSSYIDAVIRVSSLSDIFTQDLTEMNPNDIRDNNYSEDEIVVEENLIPQEPITCRQMDLCKRLLNENRDDSFERQELIESLDNLSKIEASKLIQSLIEKRELAF